MSEPHNVLDLKDEEGKSPLDRVMDNVYYTKGCPEVAYYLMSHGCDSDKEMITKLLCGACRRGKLNVVKDLVVQHNVDPNSEFIYIVCVMHKL